MEPPESVGTFTRIFHFEYESVPVVLYRCSKTGLRLALARVQSPTVHGYFASQTEAFDDYGCPHTLEHLIFMGSERYPYKGVLDVLANRCFAQGTNAWTDTDHTCYTVDTAGSEGFLRILPVYLDHVLFPTLTDSSFETEVHHITGEGADAGVVYCEMQARENEASDMMDYALKHACYPGRCSYKAETGGRLKELRDLANKTVQDYHTAYYRPENLCVIVTGQIDYKEFCEAVAPVVESILSSEKIKALPPFERPFASPVPKPDAPKLERIEFPAEDEKSGAMVQFAWSGPIWLDSEASVALGVLMTYLTQDAVAPLRKALVETLPPLCGKIGYSLYEQTVSLIKLSLSSVDNEQLAARDVDAEVTAVLRAAAAEGGAGIDVQRIRSLIGQRRRRHFSSLEGDPHEMFSGELIGAFLYAPGFAPDAVAGGSSGSALLERLDVMKALAPLEEWPAAKWAALCDTWLLGPNSCPRVTVIGMPSKAYGEKIQADDAARVAAQKEKLGETGCKAAGDALAAAEEKNDMETPDEVLQDFNLPEASKISLINVSSVKFACGAAQPLAGAEAEAISSRLKNYGNGAGSHPFPSPTFQFDHVAGAQFASCNLLLPMDMLTVEQRELLPLWLNVAFELPLAASSLGPAMGYEAVVQALTDVTVSKSLSTYNNVLYASIKVERARYAEGPKWIARVLADAHFDAERLKVAAKRILNSVSNVKRNGRALMGMALEAMNLKDDSPKAASNDFRLERTLESITASDEALSAAQKALEGIKSELLKRPGTFFVRIAGDIDVLGNVFAAWDIHPFNGQHEDVPAPLPNLARELFAENALRPAAGAAGGCLLYSSAEESNYWMVQCDCITDARSPDLGSLLVAMEYCTALEGPFWRKIRGKGLSYSYGLSNNLEQGTIGFRLFKATDPLGAFGVAKEIISKLCGEVPNDGYPEAKAEAAEEKAEAEEDDEEEEDDDGLNPSALEGAQSGVLFGLIEEVDTIPSAMGALFSNTLDRKPLDQLQWLLKEVQAVTVESVQAALRTYVMPLFTGSKGRRVAAICPAQKKDKVLEGFSKMEPPFRLAHLDVDDLVKTIAPRGGYEALRKRAEESLA